MALAEIPPFPLRTLQGFKLTSLQHDDIHEGLRAAYNVLVRSINTGTIGNSVPVATILEYSSSTLPDGYLWANGSVVSQTTYANLYTAIGTTYNTSGEGAGNFRLPNKNGRVGMGTNPMGGVTDGTLSNRVLGTKYGLEADTQSHSHTVNITGTGTITIPSQPVTVTVTGNTATGVSGSTSLTISGNSTTLNPTFAGTLFNVSYTPTGTCTAPGLGSLSAVTVTNTTGSTALTINGVGNVTSVPKVGLTATAAACTKVQPDAETGINTLNCTDLTIPTFSIDTSAIAIASALSISPNGHTHSIPPLAINFSGSLAAPTWTATNSLNQNITPAGTVSIAANTIAAALSISPNGHTHTTPALAVTGTGTGTIDAQDVDFSCGVVGNTGSHSLTVPLIQPSLALNYIIKY